jgi:hypothetical protein
MLSEAILTARGWLFWALLFWTPLHSLAVRWPRVFFRIEIALVGSLYLMALVLWAMVGS